MPKGPLFTTIGVAALYYAAARVGLFLAIPPGFATALWPPSGIALGSALICGKRAWAGILLGSFLVNLTIAFDLSTTASLFRSLGLAAGIGAGALLQAAGGAWAIHRILGYPNGLVTDREVLRFYLLAGPVSCLVNASLSVTLLVFSDAVPLAAAPQNWLTWWLGDTMGALIFAPLLLTFFGEPRDAWAYRRRTAALPLLLCFTITLAFFFHARTLEANRQQEELRQSTEAAVEHVTNALLNHTELVFELKGFFDASNHVDRDEFRRFSRVLLKRHGGIQALSWNARVSAEQRQDFEQAQRDDGLSGFGITERDAGGHLVPGRPRAEYFPATYIEPLIGNAEALGFDVASDPVRRAALSHAMRSGSLTVTPLVKRVPDRGHPQDLLLILPVYRQAELHGSERQPEDLAGFVAGELLVGKVIEDALGSLDGKRELLRIVVRDRDAPANAQILFAEPGAAAMADPLSLTREFMVGDRHWLLIATAIAGIPGPAWNVFYVLFAAAGFTALLGGFLLALGGRTLRMESVVRERTEELSRKNDRLLTEIDSRIEAESGLKRSQESLLLAKEEAERANEIKGQFLANMSHEIRTPMNAIIGMLYLALKTELAPSQRNYLVKAQGAAHSLLGIINDILDFSKIDAGKLEIESIEFSLDSVLERLTDAIGYQAEHKGLEFLIRYDVNIPSTLIGDPLRLGQVLLNLCSNAIKFTEEGEVELAFRSLNATHDDLILKISVRDTGIGMPSELQSKLFQKFTQADQSTTRKFGGTGLGLAISKHLVEQMGGRIWIEDSQPGKGTTFCCTVQLQIARQAQVHRQELLEQAGPLLKGIRVLVVDDNEVSREILAEMLRYFHLDAYTAANGPAAIDWLESATEPVDLVLMDWRMPGMTGDEAIRRIRAAPAIVRQPKVVMVTAYGREEVIALAEQAGVNGFLMKPISPSTLLDTVLSVLGRGRLFDHVHVPKGDGGTEIARNFAGIRLLLVEDNEINREFTKELLRSMSIDADEAVNGEEAVAMVQSRCYDAVLMDIQMPVMDGLEAARRIRGLAPNPGGQRYVDLPIIAMTALAMAQDAENSHAAGMNDHITKPVDPERLAATLARWLRPGGTEATVAGPAAGMSADAVAIACPADLQALRSLDAAQGVRRIGGNPEAYRKQLRRFSERYGDAVGHLRRVLAEQGARAAEDYCHALKGVAGNLGATRLFQCLAEVDGELKRDLLPDDGLLERLAILLQEVMDEINGLGTPARELPQAGSPLDSAALAAKLTLLADALENDLGAAETVLADLRSGVAGSVYQAAVSELAATVDVFAVDDARAQVAALLNRLAKT